MRLVLFAALCACAGAAPRLDPLADLNRIARDAYADARGRALASAGPVLIVGPARIALLNGGARTDYELAPARYQELKAICHLALGLHALHYRAVPDPRRLEQLRAAADRAIEALHALTPEQIERQREIVRLSFDETRPVELRERALAPRLRANAHEAANTTVADLDAAVESVRRALTAPELAHLHVFVVGAHLMRE